MAKRERKERPRGPKREIAIDPVLHELAYRCTEGCPRGRTCCTGLAVEVSPREMRAIDAVMDEVARLVPGLRVDGGYENVFVDDPPELLIEPLEDGSCPFLYRARGRALCSIHTVALASGRRVADVKPASCRHWPIRVEREQGRLTITIHEAARRIGCVAPSVELPGHPSVAEAFRAEIAEICGGRFPGDRDGR